MTGIFNFFGSILGYLLWGLYTVFKNYGVAIILFTIILKVIVFPLSLKSQKSTAQQSKLSTKQKELQTKYSSNKQKYNEELQKLYEKEGANPGSGCLMTMLPFPIMLGIYYSVIFPLSNTLHIAKDTIALATDYMSKIPGMVSVGAYTELEIIKNFDVLQNNLTMFSADDVEKINFFQKGFTFFGFDLLTTPQNAGFKSLMWIIPLLSLIISLITQVYSNKKMMVNTQGQQQGCMKVVMYLLPLTSVYFAYIMPAAVGFYWVVNGLVSFLQMIVTNKFFSANHLLAKDEGVHFATMTHNEASIKPLPVTTQKQLADQIATKALINQKQEIDSKQKNLNKKKSKKSGNANASDQYRGNKK